MILTQLHIQTLRNLNSVQLQPVADINCLIGPNGSGKTSILEAIYLLGMGRSFRSSQLNRIIQQNAEELVVFAEVKEQQIHTKLGYSRDINSKSRMKKNGETVSSVAELAQLLPLLLLYADSYTLFRDSPSARRKWLDWGMFHVEPQFYPLWKKLQRVLHQRNILLKQSASNSDIKLWDVQLVEFSQKIHTLRASFMQQWKIIIRPVIQSLFDHIDLELTYSPGWDLEIGLEEVLVHNLQKDRALGYTTAGPQRADICVYMEETPAQHVLSLGQQKLLVSGIILSQASLLRDLANKTPVLLIDDLPAELDSGARERIANIIHGLNSQVFLTGIDLHTLEPFINSSQSTTTFHVEHGAVSSR